MHKNTPLYDLSSSDEDLPLSKITSNLKKKHSLKISSRFDSKIPHHSNSLNQFPNSHKNAQFNSPLAQNNYHTLQNSKELNAFAPSQIIHNKSPPNPGTSININEDNNYILSYLDINSDNENLQTNITNSPKDPNNSNTTNTNINPTKKISETFKDVKRKNKLFANANLPSELSSNSSSLLSHKTTYNIKDGNDFYNPHNPSSDSFNNIHNNTYQNTAPLSPKSNDFSSESLADIYKIDPYKTSFNPPLNRNNSKSRKFLGTTNDQELSSIKYSSKYTPQLDNKSNHSSSSNLVLKAEPTLDASYAKSPPILPNYNNDKDYNFTVRSASKLDYLTSSDASLYISAIDANISQNSKLYQFDYPKSSGINDLDDDNQITKSDNNQQSSSEIPIVNSRDKKSNFVAPQRLASLNLIESLEPRNKKPNNHQMFPLDKTHSKDQLPPPSTSLGIEPVLVPKPDLLDEKNSIPSSSFSFSKILITDYSNIDDLVSELTEYSNDVIGSQKKISSSLIRSTAFSPYIPVSDKHPPPLSDQKTTNINIDNSTDEILKPPANTSPKKDNEPTSETLKKQTATKILSKFELEKISFKIYIGSTLKYYPLVTASFTSIQTILEELSSLGIIDSENKTWSIYEVIPTFGIERPINVWEGVGDIFKSWESSSNNYLIIRPFYMHTKLLLANSVTPNNMVYTDSLQFRLNKSKWIKHDFTLSGLKFEAVKQKKSKLASFVAHLDMHNIYIPYSSVKGSPTKFIFGLKPNIPSHLFEKPEVDYIKWFCAHNEEVYSRWVHMLRMSINQHKFRFSFYERCFSSNETPKENKIQLPSRPLVNIEQSHKENNFVSPENSSSIENDPTINQETSDISFSTFSNIPIQKLLEIMNSVQEDIEFIGMPYLKKLGLTGFHPNDSVIDGPTLNQYSFQNEPSEMEFLEKTSFVPGSLLEKVTTENQKREVVVDTNNFDEVFKKGSLLSRTPPNNIKTTTGKGARLSPDFTKGSLLQGLQQKPQRVPKARAFGQPLVDISSDIPIPQIGALRKLTPENEKNISGTKHINDGPLIVLDSKPDSYGKLSRKKF
ncbi:hypothetical protein BB558_005278 [Smittium angustum]|uniref:PH domain-containing protein n=1 Tax=Smittium angustum TaxID=133377 RepID=A0A2U1J0Y0_SMIAN|nr:hypothetical protein BB558_005278 [Smittium angustum]